MVGPPAGLLTKRIQLLRAWADPLLRPKQWNRDMEFRRWNVKGLYRPPSLTRIVRELTRYKLDLVGCTGS